MAELLHFIACELSEGNNIAGDTAINICYMRENIDDEDILFSDITFFCCYTIRQLVNLKVVKPEYAAEVANELSTFKVGEGRSSHLNNIYSNFENEGRRISSLLNFGVGPYFECGAEGFWLFKNKALFAAQSVLVMLEYLLDESAFLAHDKIVKAARDCGYWFIHGEHPLHGKFSIQNQWVLATGIAEDAYAYESSSEIMDEITSSMRASNESEVLENAESDGIEDESTDKTFLRLLDEINQKKE